MLHDQLGDWLEWQRRNSKPWLYFLAGSTLLMWLMSFWFKPFMPADIPKESTGFWAREQSLYVLDWIPGFWCVFGMVSYFLLVMVLRKWVLPFLLVSEGQDRD